MSTKCKVEDALGAADSYIHAIRQIFEKITGGAGSDYCSLDLLAETAQAQIADARSLVDDLVEPVEKSNSGEN